MVSRYLTEEASAARLEALAQRIAREHRGSGPYTFDPESSYLLAPESVRRRVAEILHEEELPLPPEICVSCGAEIHEGDGMHHCEDWLPCEGGVP